MRKLEVSRRVAFLWFFFVFHIFPGFSHGGEDTQPLSRPEADAAALSVPAAETPAERRWWQTFVGKSARDALLLGMWSLHLDGTGEYFGDGRNNDQGHLIGLQVAGVTAGTFINSHDDRTYFGGLAREVYSTGIGGGVQLDLGYKFGLMYGYDDDLMNLFGISPFAVGTCGLTWNRVGVDFGVIPVGILTLNFRFDIDDLWRVLD